MIGCLIVGGLAAFAVVKLVHARRCGYAFHGCAGHGHHHADRWAGYGGELGGWQEPHVGGERFLLGHVLARVRATPAQERVITEAWRELRGELERLRGEGRRTRADVAEALRKPAFDEVLLGELYARHDGAIEAVRKAFVGFFAKTHEALEDEQRRMLADLVEGGVFRRGWRW